MKALALLSLLALSGCQGLNVQWAASASYNTPNVRTEAVLTPGAATRVSPAVVVEPATAKP